MRQTIHLIEMIVVAVAISSTAMANHPPATFSDVAYGIHPRQKLDVWLASSNQPLPLVVYLHGGGWQAEDKSNIHDHLDVAAFLANGISVASVNYRLLQDANEAKITPPVQWPLVDAARALQFLRSKAVDWRFDKSRIAASGVSAGGCSSLWLAMHHDLADQDSADPIARESTRLFCVAAKAPVVSLDPKQLREWIPNSIFSAHAFGFAELTRAESFAPFLAARDSFLPQIQRYSPIEHATKDDPPVFMEFPTQDKPPRPGEVQTDPNHSAVSGLMLERKLNSLGVNVELRYRDDGKTGHSDVQDFLMDVLTAGVAERQDLYVNPQTGNDSADGRSEVASDRHAPFKTIARAVRVARGGDTIHLAKAIYKEPVGIYGPKTGLYGRPIIIDGHDSVISGCIPLELADWKEVAPGLYRNESIFKTVLHSLEDWVARFSFIIDGKLVRMNHSVKAPGVAWKLPAELKPGEWTYQQDDLHAFMIRIDSSKKLIDCNIEMPVLVSGVQFAGNISHFIVKNLTVTHVINDGFALTTGHQPNGKVRDILFQNCQAIDVCDDGLSAHGDCEVRVDGLVCDGCSTGIASQGTSVNERVVTRNIHGVDLLFGQGIHQIKSSRIEADGNTAGIFVDLWPKAPEQDRWPGQHSCTVKLENVVVTGSGNTTGTPKRVIVSGARSVLDIEQSTIVGMSVQIKNGGAMKLHDSIIGGGSRFNIEIISDSHWDADHNLYDLGLVSLGGVAYSENNFAGFKKATGQEAESEWKPLDQAALLAGSRVHIGAHPVGADMTQVPLVHH